MNNLTNNSLSIGQVLKIASDTPSNNTYMVKSGDTLYSIARNYGLSVEELKALNNLSGSALSIGQVLKIKPETTSSNETDNYYIVQKGDSLYKIANRFKTTVNEIVALNNLKSTLLSIGQRLLIPTDATANEVYVVQKGDTLYGIARKLNTTVSEIQSLNNLVSSTLSVGQKLLIP